MPDWADLLGRKRASPEPALIPEAAGLRILVTGAGGFIGSEMVRILAASGAQQLVLLEIAEQKLFEITAAMTARGYGGRCIPVLGSVCDPTLLAALFERHRPHLVLHAAALKHVPLMEHNPFAAVETNSLGTWLLARTAEAFGARHMILVSTDKAVAPHSIMGASKRVAELALLSGCEHRPAPKTMRRTAVRLVNVIGSPCSVAPAFAAQIAGGRPVTVTHPEVRRFFLTLPEVVALLAEAIAPPAAEGILIPNPGAPVQIADLARRMVAASGLDIPLAFTGLRPGDKLDESLLSARETDGGPATPSLRRVLGPMAADLESRIHDLRSAIAARDLDRLLHLVQALVPDYQPSALLRTTAPELASAQP